MRWTCLGHAMWLVEAAGLRLLLDPLLGATYHDGVFAPVPQRRIDIEALRPDVIVVTHRHPDHFDVDSLDLLAQRYPDAIVLTADVLVGQVCQRLGFASVSLLEDWQHLALGGLDLLTTPSFCAVEEWGVILATDDGVAWNMVDTELGGRVPAVLSRAAEILGRPGLADGITLAIPRWQPLLQVDALLGKATGFPARRYAAELDRIAACKAAAIIPGAAGSQLAAPGHWLNAFAYPVSAARLRRDLARRCPDADRYTARPGARWVVSDGAVSVDGDAGFVDIVDERDERTFRPLSIPPLSDPDPERRGREALQAIIDPWIRDTLALAAGRRIAKLGAAILALEVVYPSGEPAVWTMEVGADTVRLTEGAAAEPDLCNQIAASDLAAVIEGRSPWGRALLSGRLRSAGALYTVGAEGLEAMRLPPFFVYLALSYAEATERWVAHAVARCLAAR